MTIFGNATSYGRAAAELLMSRVDKFTSLYYRTVERLLKLPYRTSGGVNPVIKEKYGLYIEALLPSSFAVAFQVGKPNPQIPLFPELEPKVPIDPELVVDEVMRCFEILEGTNPGALKERFDDHIYYDNFIGLVKQIAPDGDEVKLVGFTVKRNGNEKPVALRKSQQQLRNIPELSLKEKTDDEETIKKAYTGILMHANSPLKGKFGTVKLFELSSGGSHIIRVPIALMKDVVQPFYEERVTISISEKKGTDYLEDIELAKI